jgi:hypothetical protein
LPASGVEANASVAAVDFTQQQIDQLKAAMVAPIPSISESVYTPAKTFANDRLGQFYDLTYSLQAVPVAINDSHLAWRLDFSGKPKTGQGDIKGSLIYASGQKTTYYFLVYSASN